MIYIMETEFYHENHDLLFDSELRKNPKYKTFFSPKKSK